MSRKIILRSGMEHVLKGTRRSPDFFLQREKALAERDLTAYLRTVRNYLDRESDKKLFLGLGLVVGTLRKKKRKRKITAPLLFMLVDIDVDEDEQQLISEVQLDSIALNYDLVTMIIEQDFDLDDDSGDGASGQLSLIQQSNLQMLEGIEKQIDATLNHPGLSDEKTITASLAIEVFNKLVTNIDEFRQIKMENKPLDYKEIISLTSQQESSLLFCDRSFFYVTSFPNQLSTYIALRQLIKEVG